MQTKGRIWIYGASGHGKVILDCLQANNLFPFGFIDDDPNKKNLEKLSVYSVSAINKKSDKVLFGIGDNETRKKLDQKGNYQYLTVVHPTATLSPHSNLDDGTVVFHMEYHSAIIQITMWRKSCSGMNNCKVLIIAFLVKFLSGFIIPNSKKYFIRFFIYSRYGIDG